MKKFNNKPSKCITHNNEKYWISRSVALVGVVFVNIDDKLYLLTEKRSKNMDSPGKQCLPCGYLDWNETGWEGINREVFEETSLDLAKLKSDLIYCNNEEPFFVKTTPGENRQNVTLNYVMHYNFGDTGHYAMLESEKYKDSEVDEVKWVLIEDIKNYDWAFEHNHLIIRAYNFLKDNCHDCYWL